MLWSLLGAVFGLAHAPPPRELMISGDVVTSSSQAPFLVSLLQCTTSGSTMYCAKFCSGSLIAPDVVLTAGHCVHNASSQFGVNTPPVALGTMYVMAGSVDVYNISGTLKLVSRVVNYGYSLNVRYSFDKDLGLVFLESCFDLIPGEIETVKLSTLSTEPDWASESTSCADRTVRTFGFGVMSNLPSEISKDNGKLKSISTLVHTPEVCLNAYLAATFANAETDLSVLDEPQYLLIKEYYYSLLAPEYHICSGGNRDASACFGDSGGPVVAFPDNPAKRQIVAVTSFGSTGFCGLGPDFNARVASNAQWVLDQMEAHSAGCASVQSSFSEYPFTRLPADEYATSRCLDGTNTWQCEHGACIAPSLVCDGSSNCGAGDNSDEDSDLCPTSRRRLLEDPVEGNCPLDGDGMDELNALISAYLAKQAPSVKKNRIVVVQKAAVVVVGTLNRGDDGRIHVEGLAGLSGLPRTKPPIPAPSANSSTVACSDINATLRVLIADEVNRSVNTAQNTPGPFSDACARIDDCKLLGDYTASSSLDDFCTSMKEFVRQMTVANLLIQNFNSTYSLACASEAVVTTVAPATGDSSQTTTTTQAPAVKGGGSNHTPLSKLTLLLAAVLLYR